MDTFFSIENHRIPTSHFSTFPKSSGKWKFPAQAKLVSSSSPPPKYDKAPTLSPPALANDRNENNLIKERVAKERYTKEQESLAVAQDPLGYAHCFSDDELLSVWEGGSSADQTPFLEQECKALMLVNEFPVFPDGWNFETVEQSIQELKHSNCEAFAAYYLGKFADCMCTFKDLASQQDFNYLFITSGGVSVVTKAMTKYPNSGPIQRSGASVLAAVTECHEPSRREIVSCSGVELSVAILRNFVEDESALCSAAFALKTLLMCDHYMGPLKYCMPTIEFASRAGAVKELVKTLKKYPNNATLCLEVCSCLHHLVLFKKSNAKLALRDGAREAVGKAIVTFRDSSEIQSAAIALIDILTFVHERL